MGENIGVYKVTAKDSTMAGHRYLGLDCTTCKQRFAIFDDPSGGSSSASDLAASINLTEKTLYVVCPRCKGPNYQPGGALVSIAG